MKKPFKSLLSGLIVAGSLAGSLAVHAADTIKVGWMGSLTGDQAVWGISELNTIKMLAEEANKKGGWIGKQIEIIGYDTKGDATEAVVVTKRLVSQDKVSAILGPNASGQAIAISQILQEGGVGDISTVATNPKVTVGANGKVKPFNFRVCYIDPYQGAVAGGFAADVLKYKTAAILFDVSDEYSQGLSEFFEKTFTEKGGKIVAKEAFKSGDLDFRAQLSKIKASKPDVIFMPYFFKEVALSANQARELGIKATLMGGDGWTSSQLLEMAQGSLEGSYIVDPINRADSKAAALAATYKAKYNTEIELNGYMANDAFKMLEDSVLRAKTTDSKAIAAAMASTDIQGVTGRIKINPETHNPDGKQAGLLKVVGKEYKFQQFYSPK